MLPVALAVPAAAVMAALLVKCRSRKKEEKKYLTENEEGYS